MNDQELFIEYESRYSNYLIDLAVRLEKHLIDHLTDAERIDRVSARAKSPNRFIDKAAKIEKNKKKYSDPMKQIQDQIGARIITFYLDDVEKVSQIIDKYYRFIESRSLIPENESEFGYVGKHYILFIPEDLFLDAESKKILPNFFELQIKTLFQHAWSEANHDLGYKTDEILTPSQKRLIAFTSAQAWGADHIFENLRKDLAS